MRSHGTIPPASLVFLRRAIVAGVVACVAARAAAQGGPVSIAGVVADSASRVGLAGAEVIVDGTSIVAITDDRGEFRIAAVSGEHATLHVRRLGFRPRVVAWDRTNAGDQIRVELVQTARALGAVLVRAERTRYTGRLAEYYERLERRSTGQFITREEMEQESQTQLSQVLRRAPGVGMGRGRNGVPSSVRMRGRNCAPLVWLDGAQMGAGDIDIDSFSPSSLEGIELYLGSASAPSRYQGVRGKSECGTILLWSRGPETDPRRVVGVSPSQLEAMIASLTVFTAEQVDTSATLDTVVSPSVVYPQSLRATGASGIVVAEIVVDTTGAVETDHIGIMSATHPLFAEAVRQVLPSLVFRPARRGGRTVRQVVRMPFTFQAPAR